MNMNLKTEKNNNSDQNPTHESGLAMFVTVFMALVLGMVSAVTVTTTLTRHKDSRFELDRLQARCLAEAILDAAQKQILEKTANFEDPFEYSTTASGTVNIGSEEYSWNGIDLTSTVYPLNLDALGWSPLEVRYNSTATGDPNETHIVKRRVLQIFPGNDSANGIENGSAVSRLRRTIEVQKMPLFDFAVFFDDKLEIHPGKPMTIEGKVHANGDIYVTSNNGLGIDTDYFRCTGEIFRTKWANDTNPSGAVTISKMSGGSAEFDMNKGYEDFDPSNLDPYVQNLDDTFEGTVQTASHGVQSVNVPDLGSISNTGHFIQEADLIIHNGNFYKLRLDSYGDPIIDSLTGMPTLDEVVISSGAIEESSTDMYDDREETFVELSEIDLSNESLRNYITTNEVQTIYAYRSPHSTPQAAWLGGWDPGDLPPGPDEDWFGGICLKNGSDLPADLLFVSENPVYVQGDFNNENKKSAAVISDAVNLLSNEWDMDGQHRDPDDERKIRDIPALDASPTEYNMAMVTGHVRTPDGPPGNLDYSGGYENLPRFHEDWRNVECTIRGAFINLFQSRQATTPMPNPIAYLYRPPNRTWQFDKDLLNGGLSDLRDLFPQAVSIDRLVWEEGQPILPGT